MEIACANFQYLSLKDLKPEFAVQSALLWQSKSMPCRKDQLLQPNALKYRAESDCLNTPFAILKLSSLKFLFHAFYESYLVYKFG